MIIFPSVLLQFSSLFKTVRKVFLLGLFFFVTPAFCGFAAQLVGDGIHNLISQETNNNEQVKEALELVEGEIRKFEKELQETYEE